MADPLVSIITPFLNAEKFFAEEIESVINQSYENWELLLIDDGSTDKGALIAEAYARRDGRIRCYHHPNRKNLGKSTSRNLGISNSRGEYIAFLDADDTYLPQKLDEQVRILQSSPSIEATYGATLYWFSWSGDPNDAERDYIRRVGVEEGFAIFDPPELLISALNDAFVPSICAPVVRRSSVIRIGGFDESIQQLYEDQVFLAKMWIHLKIYVDHRWFERYRQHNDSTWYLSVQTGEDVSARYSYLCWLREYLEEQKVSNAKLHVVLKESLASCAPEKF